VLKALSTYIHIIVISLLMSHRWGTGLPNGLPTRRTGHNPPRGPSSDWWVLTTANAAGTNGLRTNVRFEAAFEEAGARDNKFLVTHLTTDQRCLTSAITRRSPLTVGPSSSLINVQCKLI
jgi:hypothetical protein